MSGANECESVYLNDYVENKRVKFTIAAPMSGSGKTSVAIGLLGVFLKRGFRVQPFKVGPDFIDSAYHRRACGVPSINLDSFLLGKIGVQEVFTEYFCNAVNCNGAGRVLEGAIGSSATDDAVARPAASPEVDSVVNASADSIVIAGVDSVVNAGAGSAVNAGADSAVNAGADSAVNAGADSVAGKTDEVAVVEGVMGLYDGIGSSFDHSTFEISKMLGLPIVLVLNAAGMAASVAAIVKGYKCLGPADIRAVILNNVSSLRAFNTLKLAIEENLDIPCIGYLPRDKSAEILNKRLGLISSYENEQIAVKVEKLIELVSEHIDIDMLLRAVKAKEGEVRGQARGESALERKAEEGGVCREVIRAESAKSEIHCSLKYTAASGAIDATDVASSGGVGGIESVPRCKIAIAMDKAFNFYYEDNLNLLRRAGAEIVFFSPISDKELPNCDGIYIGGGFPENFAKELSNNNGIRSGILDAAHDGMPIYAESGGYVYLMENLALEDEVYKMCGVFKGSAVMGNKLNSRFGYIVMTLLKDTVIGLAGKAMNAHEFHYAHMIGAREDAYTGTKASTGESWICGNVLNKAFGSFGHIFFRGNEGAADRFVEECAIYSKAKIRESRAVRTSCMLFNSKNLQKKTRY